MTLAEIQKLLTKGSTEETLEAVDKVQDLLNDKPPTEMDLMEAETPEEFTALSLSLLEALSKGGQ